jgi:alpha-tubulin suppressor-like RCC1 family protein
LALGSGHSCAALQGGGVYCWGWNNYGQLGNASAVNSSTRVAVASLASNVVTSLAAGDGHTCALLTGFSARCWGDNANGQLGTGTRTNSSTPVPVALGL